jgi:hypothetical protein
MPELRGISLVFVALMLPAYVGDDADDAIGLSGVLCRYSRMVIG